MRTVDILRTLFEARSISSGSVHYGIHFHQNGLHITVLTRNGWVFPTYFICSGVLSGSKVLGNGEVLTRTHSLDGVRDVLAYPSRVSHTELPILSFHEGLSLSLERRRGVFVASRTEQHLSDVLRDTRVYGVEVEELVNR